MNGGIEMKYKTFCKIVLIQAIRPAVMMTNEAIDAAAVPSLRPIMLRIAVIIAGIPDNKSVTSLSIINPLF
jgi:hypothetical protein